MRWLSFLVWTGIAFGQTNLPTPVVIPPKADDSATGELRFREKRASGTNYVGFRAPSSIGENIIWILPDADGEAGKCWGFGATATLGWVDCAGGGGSGDLPVVDTTAIVKGSADATKQIRFEVDGLSPATTRVLTVPDADITLLGASRLVSTTYPLGGGGTLETDLMLICTYCVDTQTAQLISGEKTLSFQALHLKDADEARNWDILWKNDGGTGFLSSSYVSVYDAALGEARLTLYSKLFGITYRAAILNASLYPTTGETYDLGTTAGGDFRWNKLAVKDIDMSGTFTGSIPTPPNMVTTDTDQTITGQKTFTQSIRVGTAANNLGITVGPDLTAGSSFVNAQKFEIRDRSGWGAFWNIQSDASSTEKKLLFLDTSNEALLTLVRQELSILKREARFAVDLLPVGEGYYHVGSAAYRWGTVWAQNINFSGTLTGTIPPPANMVTTDTPQAISGHKTFNSFSVGQVASGLMPSATATYALGASSFRWQALYAVVGDFLGPLTVSSSSAGHLASVVNSGSGPAILGWAQGSGIAVTGLSATGYGVMGSSSSSYGVYGTSGTSYGGYFSGAAAGIYATGSGGVAVYAAGHILATGVIGTLGGITAGSGFTAGSSQGLTHMATVRKGDNSGACYLWFTGGILTGSTCM